MSAYRLRPWYAQIPRQDDESGSEAGVVPGPEASAEAGEGDVVPMTGTGLSSDSDDGDASEVT